MASKVKLFSWSKGSRQSVEPYHRTGGLLSIDTSVGDAGKEAYLESDAQNAPRPGRQRPPNLNLTIPSDKPQHRTCLSPASARHNAALVNSASNLLAVVNDMLRSPALSATVCPRSAELHKPLPSRPRSVSLPSVPDLPVELPGSILLENQGFPSPPAAGSTARSTCTMSSARSSNTLRTSAAVKPSPSKVPQHKRSFSEANLKRQSKSRPNLIKSSSSTDSKLTTCSVSTNGGQTSSSESTKARVGAEKLLQPSPLIVEGKPWRKSGGENSNHRDELGSPATPTPTPTTRTRQVEDLKSTITAQDSTISTLQAQFGSLRASHEAHVASLTDAHSAEVASLREYTRVLEEQQSQRTLHHASSNHLLLYLDPNEPQSPNRESPPNTTSSTSATSIRSFKSAFEQPIRSPTQFRESPEMDNLKRKLSSARRPETGNREVIRELNQYKQNNAALQKQIESLMAKLNQSKKNERTLTTTLEGAEKNSTELQEKAGKAEQLEKATLALQNTIDNLEHRLELANCEKLDAEEQLYHVQSQSTPFDTATKQPPKLQVPGNGRQSAHTSMSTIFSSDSPTSRVNESQEPSTLAAFISHIERLQEQIKQKDARIAALEEDNEQLCQNYERLEREHRELGLQSDIQGQLLRKTSETDVHIEELRTAIIKRESIIGEKEKALRHTERSLEHHKLLLHAEIRRHAAMSTMAFDNQGDPLPDLSTLASKEDIDRWILRLRDRLKRDCSRDAGKKPLGDPETQVQDLKQEIDFYVREIIYYKLDIKGYKSDIKKLKNITTRLGSYGSRTSDVGSPTSSLARSVDTPVRARFSHGGTPGLGISSTPSPISTGPISASVSVGRPITPLPAALPTPEPSPADTVKPTLAPPMTPQTPIRKDGINLANEADNIDPGISPRSIARLSPERRKPTPPSPDQEKFGDLATNFPLSTPAAPKRHDTQRSMSDSIIQLYAAPRTPEGAPTSTDKRTPGSQGGPQTFSARQRSGSLPDNNLAKLTPDRPPRPQYGLYESPKSQERAVDLPLPPRMDVMAEAMRNSPDRGLNDEQNKSKTTTVAQKITSSTKSAIKGLSNRSNAHSSSSTSGTSIPAPLTLRTRSGSAGSSTAAIAQPSSPQRKGSNASGSSIPFIIGMPSPHNPALISPSTSVPPSACSITGKSASTGPLKSPTSRTGVGGTMASSTPLTSPIEPADTGKPNPFGFGSGLPISKGGPSRSGSTAHSRNLSQNSIPTPSRTNNESGLRSGGHSRSMSGSSIRSAMQLPSSLMKGKGKTRKDSISNPTPLASPFDIDRGNSGTGFSIGQAI